LSATVPQINNKHIYPARFPCPSQAEQCVIAHYLDRETTKIDQMIAKVETAIERLQEYRAALITAAVTGKIDVREFTTVAEQPERESTAEPTPQNIPNTV
jgi:type I restriction enzyme S subunit